MKIRNNITILINEYWLRNITRYEEYYNLSLVSYKFLILNLSLTITIIKLGTFFTSKFQGGGLRPFLNLSGGWMSPRPPLYPPLNSWGPVGTRSNYCIISSVMGPSLQYKKWLLHNFIRHGAASAVQEVITTSFHPSWGRVSTRSTCCII